MKTYYPYKSDKPDKKYYIITKTGKRVYFGYAPMQDYTEHKDEVRKNSYIKRHQKRENWNDPDTAGYWSRWYLWEETSRSKAYDKIKNDLKNRGYLS